MLKTMTDFIAPESHITRSHALQPWIDEARSLIRLALPLIVMQLAQMGSITADVIMVGVLGKEALAATSIGAVMFYFSWLGGYGPVAAVSPIVSQILGAHPDDRARVRAAVRMGLWAVGFISLPLMTILIWAKPVLLALGQEPAIVDVAAKWVHIVALGLPFTLGFGVLRNFASAIGKQTAVLAISVITLLFNIAMNYVLIYGHFGAPAMGVLGAAAASAMAYAFSFFAMLAVILLAPGFRKYHLLHRFGRADWAKFSEIFRLGAPMGMSMIFEAMLFNSATLIMGTFGAASVAANQIAMNVGSLTFMVPLGIGLAATVRVGLAAALQFEHRRLGVVTVELLDDDRIRVVNEPLREVLEQAPDVRVAQTRIPWIFISLRTWSLGWAPLAIQLRTLSSSSEIVDGLVWAL